MYYKFYPQRRDLSQKIIIDKEIITITINDKTEVFDFTNMPEGKMDNIEIEILPFNPIVSAERINGVLKIEILKFHGNLIRDTFDIDNPDYVPYPSVEWQDSEVVENG